MLKNYFKIAWRNLIKHKFISGINLFGLTMGLTSCLLILAYVTHELSYDRYNDDATNTYRVERTFLNPETKEVNLTLGAIAPPFAPLLANDFKEIKKITTLFPVGSLSFKYENKIFNEADAYFAEQTVFDVFKINLIKGNLANSLKDPFTVLLSEEIATKYFGDEDPLDKTVKLDNQAPCKVTGVYKAFPSNSHIHPRMMISFSTLRDSAVYGAENLRSNWGNNAFRTYIVLPEKYDIKRMESAFPAFQDKHIGPKTSDYSKLSLKKLTDIHLTSHTDSEVEENGDINRVYIFSLVALFILLIACINYMNLSTARSVLRAREIGVRKVVGAGRPELIMQFLSESILITLIATVFAFVLSWIAMPALNKLTGQELTIDILFNRSSLILILLTPVVVGLISGIYPALFLSSFKSINVLKGFAKNNGSAISFRKVLVIAQFSISIVLIIATVVVYQQLSFMQNTSLGYDKDQILTLRNSPGLNEQFNSFKAELLSNSTIGSVSRSSRIPTGRLLDVTGSKITRGDSLAPTNIDIKYVNADESYLETYGISLVSGRNFSRDYRSDSSSYLINEAAAKALGITAATAVGKIFEYGGNRGSIIGVIKDFHFESMHQRIIPLVIRPLAGQNRGNLSIKIKGGNIQSAITHIEQTWRKFVPDLPFDYNFLDERFEVLYQAETRQANIFSIFSTIAIFIACLGLFGLSAFTITQRIKEIGIRKVLGASIPEIVKTLSVDFIKLVAIAAVIGIPIAWTMMNNWLEDFAYRINIQWWVLLVACLGAALVAFLTIGVQTIKAAMMNPVKSLRSE